MVVIYLVYCFNGMPTQIVNKQNLIDKISSITAGFELGLIHRNTLIIFHLVVTHFETIFVYPKMM